MSEIDLSIKGEKQMVVRVGDIDVQTTSVGKGKKVVIIHGGPGFGYYHLQPAIEYLADGFNVIAYDQRGSGRSETGDKDKINFEGQLEDLEALRQELEIEKLNLIGHSIGAHIALLYAAKYPKYVGSLVLANPGPPIGGDNMEVFGMEMQSRRTAEDIEKRSEIESSSEYKTRDLETMEELCQLRYIPFYRDRENAAKLPYYFTQTTADNVIEYPMLMMRDFKDQNVMGKLGNIAASTLVVHSELDPIPLGSSRLIKEGMPNSELLLVKGVNHFGLIEDPDLFWDNVVPFLNKNAA